MDAKQLLIVALLIVAAFVGDSVLIYKGFSFNWPWWILILLILIGIVLLILLIRIGYYAEWTGFENQKLWNWMDTSTKIIGALAIPISIIALFFSVNQFNMQQANDHMKSIDEQQQTTLETYLDRMSDLLFTQHLYTSKVGDEARQVARARTLTALQNLNPVRKGILLQFLHESALIREPSKGDTTGNNPIIHLYDADLIGTFLNGADLRGVSLYGVDLRGAVLYGANLSPAEMNGADLRGADLRDIHIEGADLSGAKNLTQQQLDQVFTCKGAILPPGLICHKNH